ncbi:MAG: hypothetical protein WDA16_05520 [Candidatus Thermoplasmatota archaeon]
MRVAPIVAMDDSAGQRSMWVGFLIGFAIYAMGLVSQYLLPGDLGFYVSMGCILVAMVFIIGWFIAVRRGFRVSKNTAGPNRMERRLREHKADEREKLRKARMRR